MPRYYIQNRHTAVHRLPPPKAGHSPRPAPVKSALPAQQAHSTREPQNPTPTNPLTCKHHTKNDRSKTSSNEQPTQYTTPPKTPTHTQTTIHHTPDTKLQVQSIQTPKHRNTQTPITKHQTPISKHQTCNSPPSHVGVRGMYVYPSMYECVCMYVCMYACMDEPCHS